jgi:hypothetical protein
MLEARLVDLAQIGEPLGYESDPADYALGLRTGAVRFRAVDREREFRLMSDITIGSYPDPQVAH